MNDFTKGYINRFNKIILTQPLANGRFVQQIFTRLPIFKGQNYQWEITYKNFSEFPFCEYRGEFIDCDKCYNNTARPPKSFCKKKVERIDSNEIIHRCEAAQSADINIDLINEEE